MLLPILQAFIHQENTLISHENIKDHWSYSLTLGNSLFIFCFYFQIKYEEFKWYLWTCFVNFSYLNLICTGHNCYIYIWVQIYKLLLYNVKVYVCYLKSHMLYIYCSIQNKLYQIHFLIILFISWIRIISWSLKTIIELMVAI